MHAITVDGDNLRWQEVPEPELGAGDVLIQSRATALNRAALAQRSGGYPPPPGASSILGLECAGVVSEVGADVSEYQVGDEVCALLSGGGYAERVVVPAGQVLPIPRGLNFHQAAALPEVFATAYLNLFMEAGLQLGERALLHAGASGVGTAGIQMCREFGSPVYVTAGDDEKIERCIALGAQAGFNRHEVSFADPAIAKRIPEWTDGAGLDVILDPVGGSYIAANLASLNVDGRLVLIGLMGGANAEVALGLMMMKRLRVIGSTLRARSVAAKTEVMTALRRQVWPLIANGSISAIVDTVLPVQDAAEGHRLLAADGTLGKVVLAID